jgi:hypothetical protein
VARKRRRVKEWVMNHQSVIPGRAKREPGISRFRVWSFGPSRNDDFVADDARADNPANPAFANT